MHLPDSCVTFPAAAHAALHAVCHSDEFAVSDLTGVDGPSRLVIARRLIREGAVTVAAVAPRRPDDAGTA